MFVMKLKLRLLMFPKQSVQCALYTLKAATLNNTTRSDRVMDTSSECEDGLIRMPVGSAPLHVLHYHLSSGLRLDPLASYILHACSARKRLVLICACCQMGISASEGKRDTSTGVGIRSLGKSVCEIWRRVHDAVVMAWR